MFTVLLVSFFPYLRYLCPLFFVIQSLSHVHLFATQWTAACQASLSFTISQSLLKLMFIESVMPSNCLIFCHPLLLLPSIFPSIRVFSNESSLCIRWPKSWSFNFSISPSNEYSGLISWMVWKGKKICPPLDFIYLDIKALFLCWSYNLFNFL